MFCKIHHSYRDIVAVCDSELLGRYFESQASDDLGKSSEEVKFQLDVKENFFNGEKVSEKELKEIMIKMSAGDATFNIIGKKSVNCALEAGIISEDGIKKIQGVPFALVLL